MQYAILIRRSAFCGVSSVGQSITLTSWGSVVQVHYSAYFSVMKVIVFSNKKLFLSIARKTCDEFEHSFFCLEKITEMDEMLKIVDIDLVLLDCDTFRPESFDILSHIHFIRETAHCIVIECSKHELDEDDLLSQISVQVMIQEIYDYRHFVKTFCKNYWDRAIDEEVNPDWIEEEKDEDILHPRKSLTQTEIKDIDQTLEEIDEFPMDADLGGGITLNDLISVDENGIVSAKDTSHLNLPPSYTLGHPDKKKYYNSKELDPNSKKLLAYFISNKRTPIPIPTLCQYMWNEYTPARRNSLYVYIHRLRIFLDDDTNNPKKLVKTSKGCFQLNADADIFSAH